MSTTTVQEFDAWDLFGFYAPDLRVEGYPCREFGRVLHWQVSVNHIPVGQFETREMAKARVTDERKAVS